MMRELRSLLIGASRLAVAGSLLVFAVSASAQEPPPKEEPQATETQPAPTEVQQAPAEPEPMNQAQAAKVFRPAWEIVVDGKAENNGVLEFVFEPRGVEPTLIKVNVVAKTKKKDIAEDLAKEITFAAGAEFKVKASGKKVKVKLKNRKSPPFHMRIESQAVNGVSVMLGKG